MRTWTIAAAFVLAATPALAQTTPAPAPAPEGAVIVAADQSGQTVEASVGASIAVQLQSTPSVGSSWVVTNKPDFLAEPTQLRGPTVTAARPILGAPTWQVFVFGVSEAGSGDVTLEKHASDGSTLETFTVTVTAQ